MLTRLKTRCLHHPSTLLEEAPYPAMDQQINTTSESKQTTKENIDYSLFKHVILEKQPLITYFRFVFMLFAFLYDPSLSFLPGEGAIVLFWPWKFM